MVTVKPLIAIVPVAGSGSRIKEITQGTNKSLLQIPMAYETFLHRTIRQCVDAGAEHVILVVGYRAEAIREALIGCSTPVSIIKNHAWAATGNGYSLYLGLLAVPDGHDVLYFQPDVVVPDSFVANLSEWWGRMSTPKELLVAVDLKERAEEASQVVLGAGGVVRIGKGIPLDESDGSWIPIAFLSENSARAYTDAADVVFDNDLRAYDVDVFDQMITAGTGCAYEHIEKRRWMEVDTPEEYFRLTRWQQEKLI